MFVYMRIAAEAIQLQQTQLYATNKHIRRHEVMAFRFYLMTEYARATDLAFLKEPALKTENASFGNVR